MMDYYRVNSADYVIAPVPPGAPTAGGSWAAPVAMDSSGRVTGIVLPYGAIGFWSVEVPAGAPPLQLAAGGVGAAYLIPPARNDSTLAPATINSPAAGTWLVMVAGPAGNGIVALGATTGDGSSGGGGDGGGP